uniref:Peptidase S1 domain-containing protein n=1 Tax=Romanomermis culicivorax TaxID=13658 RepID=A0A915JNV1_ROMCU
MTIINNPEPGINLKHFSLLFGVHDIRVKTQRFIFRIATKLFIPPDEGIKPKDVVLVRLDRQIKFNGYINGLCLPDIMEEYQLYDNTLCMTCGFGATQTETTPIVGSNTLQCIEIQAQESDWDHNLFSDWNSVVKMKATAFGPYQ